MNFPVPILATDLDGTFIPSQPLDPECREVQALKHLSERAKSGEIEIVFVTGRHFQSVMNAIEAFALPCPQWIICDVGSSLYHFNDNDYQSVEPYHDHLHDITSNQPPSTLAHLIKENLFEHQWAMRLQEAEKQTVNKLSYYCDAAHVLACVESLVAILRSRQLPHSVIHSLDPFNGDGLIDIMPRGVNKAYALDWWCRWHGIEHERIVFAGDSGNDFDALTSQYRGILVGNADPELANRIVDHHRRKHSLDRIYRAQSPFTAGVLEGCHYYGILKART